MIRSILYNAGIQPRRWGPALRGWLRYAKDRAAFRSLSQSDDFLWGRELPIFGEWDESSGKPGTYFQQDLLVAKWVHAARPVRHVDVGSRIDGFVGHLAVWREVDVIDVRPLTQGIPNVTFHRLDMMSPLPEEWMESTDSLSCLHTIEHFGLGRYGDPIRPTGHEDGLAHLKDLVKPGGMFYLSTPIGPQRIEFNAHRVFSVETLLDWFRDGWMIEKFAIIDDSERLRTELSPADPEVSRNFGCHLGVGIVAARKGGGQDARATLERP